MRFMRTPVHVGVLLLLASVGPRIGHAEDAPQRVEVTGSLIKRVASEGPAPLTVLNRQQIERIGATSVAELVRSLAAMDILDQGEFTANSPTASGTTNLQMRGMPATNLLVLLNGRRLPGSALTSSDASDAAVDVNLIPIGAIERIEVMKDGGSAVYGADAVVGVVNFITRKAFQGVELQASLGQSSRQDGGERHAAVTLGLGDDRTDGGHLLATAELFQRDPIARADRAITHSSNWRPYGGSDSRSTFHPNGNIVNASGVVTGTLVSPCPSGESKGAGCVYDTNASLLNAQNGADRFGALLVGRLRLSPQVVGHGELSYAQTQDTLAIHPANDTVSIGGQDVRIRPMQAGPRITAHSATLQRWVLGLEGTVQEVDWNVALGDATTRAANLDRNYMDLARLRAAIADGSFDPTSTSNPQSVLDSLLITPRRTASNGLRFLDAKLSGTGLRLPGGELGYAVGGQLMRERLLDEPDANQLAGNVFGSIQMAGANARRDQAAVFSELSLPLAPRVEAQLAVRHDRYYGSQGWVDGALVKGAGAARTSRKVALKVSPLQALMVRASWAEAFRMPTLKQLYGGVDEGTDTTTDTTVLCPAFGISDAACAGGVPYRLMGGANPDLKPERGTTVNLGFVLEPVRGLSLSVDAWMIRKQDEINQPLESTAVQKGLYGFVDGLWTVYTNNANLTVSRSRGIDADLQARVPLGSWGRLVVSDSATWYQQMSQQFDAASPLQEMVGTFGKPRWRNSLSLALESGVWTSSMAVRSTSSMRDTDQAQGTAAYEAARMVRAHSEVDFGVEYRGLRQLTLVGSVKNAFDVEPPFSTTGAKAQYGSLGFPWMYSVRGRYFQAAMKYTF